MAVLEFGILGPLEVRSEGVPVDLGGPRQRALLAVLLVRANEPVGADALIQALWGEEAPPAAAKALQVSVSRLRRALGPAGDRLQTAGGGYRLRVEPGELEDPRDLSRWRGPALADLRYEPALQAEIRRLEELRAAALEDLIQAALDRGEHARLAGELEALAAEYPLRERLRGLQMLALYRAGRHADALAAFQDARAALDELGLEPGPELRDLEQAILTHDPALAAPARDDGPAAPPTPTFGREDDVRAVLALLHEARLVTLTGPGGVGKTRLATEVARAAGGRFAALASTADAERIPTVVCDALAVARSPGESDAEALARTLSRGSPLLVLDNLEHLPGAAILLAGLLDGAPGLTILATSREPLRIMAERLYPVAPLALEPGVALFADRARARDPAFAPTPAVAEICRRVDGLPLAIELAAARLGVLDPDALAERLSDALAVLDRGPHDAPPRHQTMRATLDWSFDLLSGDERDAFTALGAFARGCELAAAEAVSGCALDVIEGLLAKSLVRVERGRLTMLEPVRQYAAEQLAARPDADEVHARHVCHYRDLAEAAVPAIWALETGCPEFARVHLEHDNLAAAVARGVERGWWVDVLRLVAALADYAWLAHTPEEFVPALNAALAAAGDDVPDRLRALAEVARIKRVPGALQEEQRALVALALVRRIDDLAVKARCLIDITAVAGFEGLTARDGSIAAEACSVARESGDDVLIGAAIGALVLSQEHPDVAQLPEAGARLRAAGATERLAKLFSTVAMAKVADGEYDVAQRLAREAFDDAQAIRDPWTIALVHGNLALATLLLDRREEAMAAFRSELQVARDHGLEEFYFEGLLGLSALAAADGEDERAATLEAAASRVNTRPPAPGEAPVYERLDQRFIAPARERLGTEAWTAARDAGRAMTSEAAVAYALDGALLPNR